MVNVIAVKALAGSFVDHRNRHGFGFAEFIVGFMKSK
jgi:hypothetical protein